MLPGIVPLCVGSFLDSEGPGSSPGLVNLSNVNIYRIKFLGRHKGFACVLFKLWQVRIHYLEV